LDVRAPLDESFFMMIQALAEAQRTSARGALVLGTHEDPAHLRTYLPWLLGEETIDKIHKRFVPPSSARPRQDLKSVLDTLSLASTAIPIECAVRAALGRDGSVDWRDIESFVDRRGYRVVLHERELRRRRSTLTTREARARGLAGELIVTAEELPPLRRLGLALEAESLYFDFGNSQQEALGIFLGCVEAGLRHPLTRDYFVATLRDYAWAVLKEPSKWVGLPLDDAKSLTNIISRVGLVDSDSLHKIIETLARGRSDLEKRILLTSVASGPWWIRPVFNFVVDSASARSIAEERFRYWLKILIPGYRKSRRARKQPTVRTLAAIQIGAAWYTLGEITNSVGKYRRGIRWSKRAKREGLRSKNFSIARFAADNEIVGLLNTNALTEAEDLLRQRLESLSKVQGFSAEKAVTFSSCFQLKLRQTDHRAAEAYFFEAVLQCVMLHRYQGLADNLRLLGGFANIDRKLPSPKLIYTALKNVLETYDARPI
jgi:hypothetical protein